MTLVQIYLAPKLNEIWYAPVSSEWLESWMWDDDGVIYVGF